MKKQRDPKELGVECCPCCGDEFTDDQATRGLCRRCDEQLDRELTAYLGFVAVSREAA